MVFILAREESEVLPGQGLEEAVDQLRAMILQERTHYTSFPDYLKSSSSNSSQDSSKLTDKWRLKICEWIFDVVDHFGFDRDVVFTALAYMDRSVAESESSAKPVSKREYQLYAVTSLYLAVKLHGEMDPSEGSRKKLQISAFQELSRGFFTVETIEAMERHILSLLKWRLHPPTASQFITVLLRFLPKWSTRSVAHSYESVLTRIFDTSRYLAELACCDSPIAFQAPPSFVAYASLVCAFDAVIDSTAMLIPAEVITGFRCNVAVASEVLLPGLQQIMLIQRRLKALAPNLFPQQEQPSTLVRSVSIDDMEDLPAEQQAQEPSAITSGAVAAAALASATSSRSPTSVLLHSIVASCDSEITRKRLRTD